WSLGDNHAALIALATLNSHLFLFFPTLGVLALFAFYIPACVFVDLYWRRIPYGRLRFVLGAAALIALSFYAAGITRSAAPALWQIAPQALQSDNGGAEVCAPYTTVSRTCETCGVDNIAPERICTTRQPMLKAVREVRQVARQSFGLSPFVSACSTSPLLEPARRAAPSGIVL
ncbi:MAG: hypothetical protein H7X92_14135, partial [Chitinophagales bacterium]|nr:hypothetical protein [Hyphomicrobiales bacterium]